MGRKRKLTIRDTGLAGGSGICWSLRRRLRAWLGERHILSWVGGVSSGGSAPLLLDSYICMLYPLILPSGMGNTRYSATSIESSPELSAQRPRSGQERLQLREDDQVQDHRTTRSSFLAGRNSLQWGYPAHMQYSIESPAQRGIRYKGLDSNDFHHAKFPRPCHATQRISYNTRRPSP